MMSALLRPARRALSVAIVTLSLAGCDDPAELAQEVVQARGECDQDSLKASSEACVQMFERYGAMATGAIHSYIGGMKAMDQALDRMPPPNFDTAGLGHAFTLPPDSGAGLSGSTLYPAPAYDASRVRRAPAGAYGNPGYEQGYAGEPAWGTSAPAPAPQRGVLRPPAERLARPWLRRRGNAYEEEEREALDEPGYDEPAYGEPAYRDPAYRGPTYREPAFEERPFDEPPYEQPRSRPAPRKP